MSVRRPSLTTLMRLGAVALATASVLLSVGCAGRTIPPSGADVNSLALQGGVHGGQQPISGAHVYLFAIHAPANTAPVVTSLLPSPATTDVNGAFSLNPSSYACTSPTDLAFFVAAGGNAGSGTSTNTAITLVDLFGSCSSLNAASFVAVNEVTTVAAAFALAPMYGDAFSYNTISSNGFSLAEFTSIWGNLSGPTQIAQLFATAATLVNAQTGAVTSTAATQDRQTINTLGNIAAACVNSTSFNSSPCSDLFSSTWSYQVSPASDTFTALLYVAQAPSWPGPYLLTISPPSPPFQPTLPTGPQTWALPDFYASVPGLNWSPS